MTEEMMVKVTESAIINFSQLTQDFHPLHSSTQYAKDHGFENNIAHGMLVSSYSSALIGMKLPGENAIVISQAFTYKKPVYPGDELIISGEIVELDVRFSIIEIKIVIKEKSKNKKVAIGKYKVKIRD